MSTPSPWQMQMCLWALTDNHLAMWDGYYELSGGIFLPMDWKPWWRGTFLPRRKLSQIYTCGGRWLGIQYCWSLSEIRCGKNFKFVVGLFLLWTFFKSEKLPRILASRSFLLEGTENSGLASWQRQQQQEEKEEKKKGGFSFMVLDLIHGAGLFSYSLLSSCSSSFPTQTEMAGPILRDPRYFLCLFLSSPTLPTPADPSELPTIPLLVSLSPFQPQFMLPLDACHGGLH